MVEALHALEVVIPVPLGAGRVLDGLDAGLDVLGAHLDGFLIRVADREAEMEDRDVGESAGKIGGSHSGTVTGHGT